MQQVIVIGSVPAMHYRPAARHRDLIKVDEETAVLIRQAAQELMDTGEKVVPAYRQAFGQVGVDCDQVVDIFWSWRALQRDSAPRKARIQRNNFPAIFAFEEAGSEDRVHATSVFMRAAHHLTTQDRKMVQRVAWGALPF